MEPSSANKGFIQEQPVLKNHFHDDASLQRITKLFLPRSVLDQISLEASQLGNEVLAQQIFDWVTDAEHNQPYLRGNGRDAFGKPKTELVVTEGWRKLQDFGFQKGVVALNYDSDYGPYNRLVQFIRCHLWEGSCATTLCPGAMQDGAARLLQRHLSKETGLSETERRVFQNAFDHLTSRDPAKAWTSGQWMTERTGGSDVSRTETVATYDPYLASSPAPLANAAENIPLGPWSISGFKWFSSATDSQMTILLAKTDPNKGVSAFLAPMRRHSPSLASVTGEKGTGTELNGITITRLKNKFGTKALPTAELELNNMRGWLIGREGNGIAEISTILNITRVHTTVSTVGYLSRALSISRAFSLVRTAGLGRSSAPPLSHHPLHIHTLATTTTHYHGLMLLTFYTTHLMGLDERLRSTAISTPLTPEQPLVAPLLRVLSSLHKSYVCEKAVPLVYGCMAGLGGVGYCENEESQHLNVARLFRDACVGAIWEGTTDVLAGDSVRAVKHKVGGGKVVEGLGWFVKAGLEKGVGKKGREGWKGKVGERVMGEWEGLRERLDKGAMGELLPEARGLIFRLAEVMIAVLYLVDASVNPGAEIEEMCRRWLVEKRFLEEGEAQGRKDVAMDQAIVYGAGKVPVAADAKL